MKAEGDREAVADGGLSRSFESHDQWEVFSLVSNLSRA